jgi:hypothetical protein
MVSVDQATLCLIPDESSSHCFIKRYYRVYDDNLLDENISLKNRRFVLVTSTVVGLAVNAEKVCV